MSYAKSNTKYTVPIAESTQIDDSPRASPSRSKILWGGKYTPRNNKMSPVQLHPSPNTLEKSINSPRPKALDAKIYCDTQSSGLVSRLNKYEEMSAAKSRQIANRTYSRPGDFPIVNLEKSEISIKPRQTNGATIAKIGVAAPLRLNNQASIRSTIFRTGKNYGDTAPTHAANTGTSAAGTSGSTTSNGNGSTSRDDEPIVPTSSEYDANPTQSSLDALVEISRKRHHGDELDGDFMKKQRADKSPNTSAQVVRQSSPPPNQIAKRGRDRTSPSYYNNASETSKKRYRNNDILSSLSSSMHLSSPKSVRTNLNFDFDDETSDASHALDKNAIKGRPALRSKGIERNGTDTTFAPLAAQHNTDSTPSKAQSSLQREQPPKQQKLTLFNKIYEPTVAATAAASLDQNGNDKSDSDESASEDYEDNGISFVKPKAKTSTVFTIKNNGAPKKSRLAIMLSCLSEGDARDEVDTGAKEDKAKPFESPVVVPLTTASLSTGERTTTVTFSTATTTSVLSLPSAVTTPEIPKTGASIAPAVTAASDTIKMSPISPIVSIAPIASIATPITSNAGSLPKSTTLLTFSEPAKPSISFALNTTTAASTTSPATNLVSSSGSVPRLGGFSFAATMPTTSPLTASKPDANASLVTATTATALAPAPVSAPEAAKPAPALGGFSFGASTVPKSTPLVPAFGVAAATTALPTAAPAATPPTFGTSSFGTPAAVPSFSFIATTIAASTGTVSSATSTTSSTAPTFSFASPKPAENFFGSPAPASAPAPTPVPQATKPAPALGGFSFGASTVPRSTPLVPTFGIAAPTTAAAPTFGAPAVTTAAQTPATNLFGAPTATAPQKSEPVFGSNSAGPAPAFGTQSFGGATNNVFGSAPQTQNTATPNLFGGSNATSTPSFAAPPSFGATPTPSAQPAPASAVFAFGQTAAPTTTASSGGIFGSAPTNTNTNSAFSFGQTASPAASSSSFAAPPAFGSSPSAFNFTPKAFAFGQTAAPPTTVPSGGMFGSAPTNTNTNPTPSFGQAAAPAASSSSFAAPPAFGSSPSAFNFASKVSSPFGAPVAPAATETKAAFSFNAVPNANSTSVSAFNSAPPNVSPFGNNNNAPAAAVPNSSFSFGASTNEAAKPFSFGTATTDNSTNNNMFGAPASAPSPFAFGSPAPTGIAAPPTNAFQFNAQQPTAANLFSIGPGNPSTASKNRPIRQATRRINK